MTTWELGINGFNWQADEDVLRREADLALEIGYRFAYGDMGVWPDGALEKAHRAFEPTGLRIWATHGMTGIAEWEYDIGAAAARMSKQIERAGALGIGHITYHTMVNDTAGKDPAVVVEKRARFTARFHKLFRQLAPLAEARGVSLNVENIEDNFDSAYRNAEEVISIIDPVGSPAMGACIDSGHAHMTGLSVADMIRQLGPRLRETHFHDNLGKADRHQPPGIGTIDWVAVIGALEEINFRSPIIFEWAGTYWSKVPFAEMVRGVYFNWRQFEALAEAVKAE